jgi:hypothetical protein
MLSPECVSREFTKLRSWSGQPPLDPTFLEEIYDGLQAQNINDHELVAAGKAWRFKSRFFPAPQELLDLLKVDAESQALLEWTAIYQNVGDGTTTGITDVGRKALQAIGGRWAVSNEPTGVVRKRFLESYKAFAKQATSQRIQADAQVMALPAGGERQVTLDLTTIGRPMQ